MESPTSLTEFETQVLRYATSGLTRLTTVGNTFVAGFDGIQVQYNTKLDMWTVFLPSGIIKTGADIEDAMNYAGIKEKR